VLHSLGIDLRAARAAVEAKIGRGSSTTAPSEITLSPRTKKVVELAIDEARKLGHAHVGTEHILLGIAREGGSIGADVLQSLGVSLKRAREHVLLTIGQQAPPPSAGPIAGVLATPLADRLDSQAANALARAYWEAGRLNQEEIRPEHLLLGLLTNDAVLVRGLMQRLHVGPEAVCDAVIAGAPAREGPRPAALTEAPALRETLNRAWSLALDRNSTRIRVEHLLLALTLGEGVAGNVLRDAGVTVVRLRELIDSMRG
jgi:ATP-dependent Clp protease ATP-binding subunit ClpA